MEHNIVVSTNNPNSPNNYWLTNDGKILASSPSYDAYIRTKKENEVAGYLLNSAVLKSYSFTRRSMIITILVAISTTCILCIQAYYMSKSFSEIRNQSEPQLKIAEEIEGINTQIHKIADSIDSLRQTVAVQDTSSHSK